MIIACLDSLCKVNVFLGYKFIKSKKNGLSHPFLIFITIFATKYYSLKKHHSNYIYEKNHITNLLLFTLLRV